MKRYIRLKERQLNALRVHTPSQEYRSHRPQMGSKKYLEYTDNLGAIRTELSIDSEDKVVFVGGSFVENIYVDSRSRITSYFEKLLNTDGFNIQVVNAGVSGSTTLNLFNLVINKFIPLKPKALFFFIPTNDGLCLDLLDGLWNTQKSYSNLYNIDYCGVVDPNGYSLKVQNICNIYKLLFKACELFNIDLYICASPIMNDLSNLYIVPEEKQRQITLRRNFVTDTVLDFCIVNRIKTLDLRQDFSEQKELFFDDVHSNSKGSEKIAKTLLDKAILKGFLENFKSNDKFIYEQFFFKDLALKPEIIWNDYLELTTTEGMEVVLSFDLECSDDASIKDALFCVDFDGKRFSHEECGLYLSNSVGNFTYLLTSKSANVALHYPFRVPKGIARFRIGFRLWGNEKRILVSNITLFVREVV